MSVTSQGQGWWQASDDKWYPPEQHQDDRPPPPPRAVTGSAAQSAPLTGWDPRSLSLLSGRMTRLRLVNVAALIVGVVGLLMAWGTAFIVNVIGIDTDDGKLFGAILVAAALLLWWRVTRANRLNGSLLSVVWLALLAIAVAEIVHISSLQDAIVGSGLYVDAVAAAVGMVTAVVDTRQHWSRAVSIGTTAAIVEPGEPIGVPEAEVVHTGGPATSSPIYKNWRFWVGIAVVLQEIVLVLALVNASSSKTTTTETASSAPATSAATVLPFTQLGTGGLTTSRFTVTDISWHLNWSYDCSSASGSIGNFIVNVEGYGSAAGDQIQGLNELGAGSSAFTPYMTKVHSI